MKTIRTKVYKFNELSDDAKEQAIEKHYDINVMGNWWESIYQEAENIGLRITGFDIDRGYCRAELIVNDMLQIAQKIISEHRRESETYKDAKKFIADRDALLEKDSDFNFYELEKDFLQELEEDFRIMLRNEYEYLTSEEAIKDTIVANEYEFTKDGKIFNC